MLDVFSQEAFFKVLNTYLSKHGWPLGVGNEHADYLTALAIVCVEGYLLRSMASCKAQEGCGDMQVAGGVVLAILFLFIFVIGPPSGPPSSN